jgi:hypothetical protein
LLPIHSSGVAVPVQSEPQLDGRDPVRPSSTPDAVLVLNHRLTARLSVEPPVSTRPVSGMLLQELAWPGVVHHAPSSGMNELVPLKPVAVTPATGPATPEVVPNSSAGGSTVVWSSAGIWLTAAVAPAGSSSR